MQDGALHADASRENLDHPDGLLQNQQGTELIHQVDSPKKGKLNFNIKLGKRSLGTKACVIQNKLSGSGSHKSQRDPQLANTSRGNQDLPNGLLRKQQSTEGIPHIDLPQQGKLNFKIKLGNRSLGTKTCVIPSPVHEDELSGAGSDKSQRDAE